MSLPARGLTNGSPAVPGMPREGRSGTVGTDTKAPYGRACRCPSYTPETVPPSTITAAATAANGRDFSALRSRTGMAFMPFGGGTCGTGSRGVSRLRWTSASSLKSLLSSLASSGISGASSGGRAGNRGTAAPAWATLGMSLASRSWSGGCVLKGSCTFLAAARVASCLNSGSFHLSRNSVKGSLVPSTSRRRPFLDSVNIPQPAITAWAARSASAVVWALVISAALASAWNSWLCAVAAESRR